MIDRQSYGYLLWLIESVRASEMIDEYSNLFEALFNTEFSWLILNDENRAEDGLKLREHYGYLSNAPCNVLEMIAGLAVRVGEEILWDGSNDWTQWIFFKMLSNLELDKMQNNNFNDDDFIRVMDIFLNRKYGNDGVGALFRSSHFSSHFRKGFPKKWEKLEIWYQMQIFVEENFE